MKNTKRLLIVTIVIWAIVSLGFFMFGSSIMNAKQEESTSSASAKERVEVKNEEGHFSNNQKKDGLVTLEYLETLPWEEIRDNADELFGERTVGSGVVSDIME